MGWAVVVGNGLFFPWPGYRYRKRLPKDPSEPFGKDCVLECFEAVPRLALAGAEGEAAAGAGKIDPTVGGGAVGAEDDPVTNG